MAEVRHFATSEGNYSNKEKRFLTIVNTVESMISAEARKWNETMQEKNQASGNTEDKTGEQKKAQ